ncbi:hypothetical protein [Bradyrhizobium sp. CCH5-F6]|uniref:hypothetical protein n=1 Tax=Bradyrhizobium sp. CCH5-F6 TaxID=1768753 RepID=UPI00076AD49F|nr:hypothetical protein [Bradyrhizobium sp. CCH5-F6]
MEIAKSRRRVGYDAGYSTMPTTATTAWAGNNGRIAQSDVNDPFQTFASEFARNKGRLAARLWQDGQIHHHAYIA